MLQEHLEALKIDQEGSWVSNSAHEWAKDCFNTKQKLFIFQMIYFFNISV